MVTLGLRKLKLAQLVILSRILIWIFFRGHLVLLWATRLFKFLKFLDHRKVVLAEDIIYPLMPRPKVLKDLEVNQVLYLKESFLASSQAVLGEPFNYFLGWSGVIVLTLVLKTRLRFPLCDCVGNKENVRVFWGGNWLGFSDTSVLMPWGLAIVTLSFLLIRNKFCLQQTNSLMNRWTNYSSLLRFFLPSQLRFEKSLLAPDFRVLKCGTAP